MHGEARPGLRARLEQLTRYIATPRTSKHRVFVFVPTSTLPDCEVVAIALDRDAHLAVLSSRVHTAWALSAGGRLGVGNDPRYNHTSTFKTFPFPSLSAAQAARLDDLGAELDSHRKRISAAHPQVTLTVMYNLIDKVRSGSPLTVTERAHHLMAQTDRLIEIHDSIDGVVLDAYGWDATATAADIIAKLVELNRHRRAEEARGVVRWLKPELQSVADVPSGEPEDAPLADQSAGEPTTKTTRGRWPRTESDRLLEVLQVLEAADTPMSLDDILAHWSHVKRDQVTTGLALLERRRMVTSPADGIWQRTRSA